MEILDALTILKYEKEVALYTMNSLLHKEEKKEKEDKPNFELDNAVRYIESRAKFYGSMITYEILDLQEVNVSYFVELEHRFKTRERIKEKILQKMKTDNMTMIEASNTIYDALRFTIIINDDVYLQKVEEYIKRIEKAGFKVFRFRNAWGNEFYQGLNVSFVDQDSFKFELQFHTRQSHSIKEGKLRDVYNVIRDPDSPEDLKRKSNEIRKFYQAQVKAPEGAIGYQYQSDVKKRG